MAGRGTRGITKIPQSFGSGRDRAPGCRRKPGDECRNSGLSARPRRAFAALLRARGGQTQGSASGPPCVGGHLMGPTIRLGIDLGGTKTEIVALDRDGAVALRRRVETPKDYSALLQ